MIFYGIIPSNLLTHLGQNATKAELRKRASSSKSPARQNQYLYMSSRIAVSVTVTDSSVLGGDLIREGGQSRRGFGDDNNARRNKDISEL